MWEMGQKDSKSQRLGRTRKKWYLQEIKAVNTSGEGVKGGHDIPPPAEELLTADGYGKEESHF